MEPPDDLTPEQAEYWRGLVGAFPAERFGPDQMPVLMELFRHMSIACQLAEQLDEMRKRNLAVDTPLGSRQRRIFLQLTSAARAEAHTISMLSTKLRLTDQSKLEKRSAVAERWGMPLGRPPWDVVEPH